MLILLLVVLGLLGPGKITALPVMIVLIKNDRLSALPEAMAAVRVRLTFTCRYQVGIVRQRLSHRDRVLHAVAVDNLPGALSLSVLGIWFRFKHCSCGVVMQDLLLVPKHFHGVVERAGGYRRSSLLRLSRREFLL